MIERQRQLAAWLLLAAVGTLVALATLRPEGFETQRFGWCLFCGTDAVADAIRNVVLFVPVGLLLALTTRRPTVALAVAAATSLLIEILQQWIPGRDPSIGDVVTNTTGAALGILAFAWRARWVRPSGGLALAASVLALSTMFGASLLLTPSYPRATYVADWTQSEPVDAVALAGAALANHQPIDVHRFMQRLARGDTLRIRATDPRREEDWGGLFAVHDGSGNDVFTVGSIEGRPLLTYRPLANDFGLDGPDLLFDALRVPAPGDTTSLDVWRTGNAYCASVNVRRECGVGFSLADGRTVLWFAPWESPLRRRVLGLAWIVLLVAPVGFWMTSELRSAIAILLLGTGFVVIPRLAGLVPTSPLMGLTALAGLAFGAVARRFTTLVMGPAR